MVKTDNSLADAQLNLMKVTEVDVILYVYTYQPYTYQSDGFSIHLYEEALILQTINHF